MDNSIFIIGAKLLCAAMVTHMYASYLLGREIRAANDYWLYAIQFACEDKYCDHFVYPIWRSVSHNVRANTIAYTIVTAMILSGLFWVDTMQFGVIFTEVLGVWVYWKTKSKHMPRPAFKDQNLLLLEYRRLGRLACNDKEYAAIRGVH